MHDADIRFQINGATPNQSYIPPQDPMSNPDPPLFYTVPIVGPQGDPINDQIILQSANDSSFLPTDRNEADFDTLDLFTDSTIDQIK